MPCPPLILTSALALALAAESSTPPRSISVNGEAEVKVAPDQVILSLLVETSSKDLLEAKKDNDERVKRVLGLATSFKIERQHVQTDQIGVEPRYRDSDRSHEFLGYFVHKSIVICLKDVSKFEDLLTGVLKAGTNYVSGIRFQSSDLRKHRDTARSLAMKAARAKAAAMAGELGQKLGKPRTITELDPGFSSGRSYNQNFTAVSESEDSSEGGFAPGQISVSAKVAVTFDLAD